MEMTEVFDTLKNLQSVLVEKYDLEKKVEEAPKQLVNLESLVSSLKKEYIEKNTEYEEVKARVTGLNDELASAVKSREDGEKMMDNITTHREYEALEKQISEASNKESALRESLKVEQEKLTNLSNVLKDSEIFIESQEAELNSMKDAMMKTVDGYNNRLSDLNNTENELSTNLNDNYQETIHKFHSIIRRNSEGIVAVKNGVCTGCHMILPAQFANEVRAGESIAFCPYCSRILFYEEADENDTEDYSTLDETGSLADFIDEDSDSFDDDSDSSMGGEDFGSDNDSDFIDDEAADDDSDFADDEPDGDDPDGDSL